MKVAAVVLGSVLLAGDMLASASPLFDGERLRINPRRHSERSTHQQQRRRMEGRTPAPAASDEADPWDSGVQAACMGQLVKLNGAASNPAGIAACYNLRSVNTTSGMFEAELRTYNISVPSGDWAGVTANNVNMSLTYPAATVQRTINSYKREIHISEAELVRRAELTERQGSSSGPQELRVMTYAGKLNDNMIGKQMNDSQVRTLLLPSITLSAKSLITQNMTTTQLSAKQASFVFGALSTNATTAAPALKTPFVLPGVTFGIFPVGMIVTTSWALLFVLTVGFGTIERYLFRRQFYKRVKREMKYPMKVVAR